MARKPTASLSVVDDEAEPKLNFMLQRTGFLVRRLHQISTLLFVEQVKKFQLTPVQYASLLVVDAYPGIDQARLGRIVCLDRTTVSGVARRLIGRGLLERGQQSQQRSALFLTGAGHAMIGAAYPLLDPMDEKILRPLDQGEKETFMRLLGKLVNGLESASSQRPNS